MLGPSGAACLVGVDFSWKTELVDLVHTLNGYVSNEDDSCLSVKMFALFL